MDGSRAVEPIDAWESGRRQGSLALLSAAADPVRWEVLSHLEEHGTSCVCVLQERVPVPANLLSYHLKVLRDAGLVTTTRRGRWVDYSLAEDAPRRLVESLPVSEPAVLP